MSCASDEGSTTRARKYTHTHTHTHTHILPHESRDLEHKTSVFISAVQAMMVATTLYTGARRSVANCARLAEYLFVAHKTSNTYAYVRLSIAIDFGL